MTFLMENLSTVIIGLILAGVVYLVVRKMIRDRREGKAAAVRAAARAAAALPCAMADKGLEGKSRSDSGNAPFQIMSDMLR